MRAVRYHDNAVYVDRDAPELTPGAGEALVRVTLAAIDPADLAVVSGGVPFAGVIGRRFVGVVQSIDSGRRADLVGARVVATPGLVAPGSEMARRGLGSHDPDRRVLGVRGADGCLAEYVVVPATSLARVPDGTPDDVAVFALPVARALHAARRVRLEGKAYITVLGESPEALIGAQVMTRLNASVRVLGTSSRAIELCERWGVRHRHADDAGRRQDQDVIVDVQCTPESFALACAMVRPRGTVILSPRVAPVPGAGAPMMAGVDLTPALLHEVEIVSARGGSVAEAVSLLASDPIETAPLIERRVSLDDAVAGLRLAGEPGSMTVLVEP